MIQLKSRGKDRAREIISQREIEEGTDQNSKPPAVMTESVFPIFRKILQEDKECLYCLYTGHSYHL